METSGHPNEETPGSNYLYSVKDYLVILILSRKIRPAPLTLKL